MKLLLDTHALIWFAEDALQMPNYAKALLEDVSHEKWVSVASGDTVLDLYGIIRLWDALETPSQRHC